MEVAYYSGRTHQMIRAHLNNNRVLMYQMEYDPHDLYRLSCLIHKVWRGNKPMLDMQELIIGIGTMGGQITLRDALMKTIQLALECARDGRWTECAILARYASVIAMKLEEEWEHESALGSREADTELPQG